MNEIYANAGTLSKKQVQFLAEAFDVNKTVRGWAKGVVQTRARQLNNKYAQYNLG